MTNTYSNASDLTAKQKLAGAGHGDHRMLFALCNHKGTTTGAQFKRGIGWLRCAACNTERKEQK
jgi:hypothetical protein